VENSERDNQSDVHGHVSPAQTLPVSHTRWKYPDRTLPSSNLGKPFTLPLLSGNALPPASKFGPPLIWTLQPCARCRVRVIIVRSRA
jgi:hypothetical protein